MIVYLMGHGSVVTHFPQFVNLPPHSDLKFYVPEGQLEADFKERKNYCSDFTFLSLQGLIYRMRIQTGS